MTAAIATNTKVVLDMHKRNQKMEFMLDAIFRSTTGRDVPHFPEQSAGQGSSQLQDEISQLEAEVESVLNSD